MPLVSAGALAAFDLVRLPFLACDEGSRITVLEDWPTWALSATADSAVAFLLFFLSAFSGALPGARPPFATCSFLSDLVSALTAEEDSPWCDFFGLSLMEVSFGVGR